MKQRYAGYQYCYVSIQLLYIDIVSSVLDVISVQESVGKEENVHSRGTFNT